MEQPEWILAVAKLWWIQNGDTGQILMYSDNIDNAQALRSWGSTRSEVQEQLDKFVKEGISLNTNTRVAIVIYKI